MEIKMDICFQKYTFLLCLIASIIPPIYPLEEPEREVFLPPRNFNPHPYQTATSAENSGPVTFPRTEEDEQVNNVNNIVTIPREKTKSHPVDNHPYSKVVKKNRYRLAGKYHNQDNSVNPKIVQALALHAGRVLTRPADKLKDDYIPVQLHKNNLDYAFAYKVVDSLTGDDFSHRQSQNDKATKGEYRVKLPDGRLQIVSYTADKNGYNAEVKYTEDKPTRAAVAEPSVQIQKVPVRQIIPKKQKFYDIYDYIQPQYQSYVQPTPEPIIYVTQAPPTEEYSNYVTPQPGDIFIPNNIHSSVKEARVPNVQILTTNPRDYTRGSYIPVTSSPIYLHPNVVSSTVAPPTYELNNNYVSSTISPLIVNNGNHGHIIPKTKEDYETPHHDVFLVTTVAPATVAPKDILLNGARYTLLKSHDIDLQFKKKK